MRSLGQLAALSEPLSLRYRPVVAAVLQLPPADASQPKLLPGAGPASALCGGSPGGAAAQLLATADQPMANPTQPLQPPGPSPEPCNGVPQGCAALQLPHANPDQQIQPPAAPPKPCGNLPGPAMEGSELVAPDASDSEVPRAGRHTDEVTDGSASTAMQQDAAKSTADCASMLAVSVAARDATVLVEVSTGDIGSQCM